MRKHRRKINCRDIVAGLCASMALTGGALMTDPALAESQRLRPIFELSCPEGDSEMRQALCGALQEALQEVVPHAVIRTGDSVAPLAGSLAIRLVPERETRHAMAARLHWKSDQTADWVMGPDVALDSADVALRPHMMKQLAQGLLKVSKLPLPAA